MNFETFKSGTVYVKVVSEAISDYGPGGQAHSADAALEGVQVNVYEKMGIAQYVSKEFAASAPNAPNPQCYTFAIVGNNINSPNVKVWFGVYDISGTPWTSITDKKLLTFYSPADISDMPKKKYYKYYIEMTPIDYVYTPVVAGVGITFKDTFESPVLDAGYVANWNNYWWEGTQSGGAVGIRSRTGNTPVPDNSWTDWSGEQTTGPNQQANIDIRPGRYIQRKIHITPNTGGDSPVVWTIKTNYIEDIEPPETIPGVTVSPDAQKVTVTWNGSNASDTAGYNVYISTTGADYVKINSALLKQTTFQDNVLLSNVTLYYYVTTVDNAGNESAFQATPKTCYKYSYNPPAAITDLTPVNDEYRRVNLLWSSPGKDGTAGDIAGGRYLIRYATYSTVFWEWGNWSDFENKYNVEWSTNTTPGEYIQDSGTLYAKPLALRLA